MQRSIQVSNLPQLIRGNWHTNQNLRLEVHYKMDVYLPQDHDRKSRCIMHYVRKPERLVYTASASRIGATQGV